MSWALGDRRRRLALTGAISVAVLLAPALSAASAPVTVSASVPTAASAAPADVPGYPRQTLLTEPPADPADAAIKLGLTPYHEIAPRLNALQAGSDRVSVEVIGQTVTGREVYFVTLTAPETSAQARQQEQMRTRILEQSAQAAGDRGLARTYKTPIFINNNIHGNEWEGTDAALRLIEDYASSDDPTVLRTLQSSRIYLVVSINPDGRHRQHPGQRLRLRHEPGLHHGHPARGRGRARRLDPHPADGDARPARLCQRHTHRADHPAARGELRLRPVHLPRLSQRAGDGAGHPRPGLHRGRRCPATADPVPGLGRGLGRLAADLHPAVRHLPRGPRRAHGGDPAAGQQRLLHCCPPKSCAGARRSTPTSHRPRWRPRSPT